MTTPDLVALVERLLKVESGNADFVTGLCTNWHRNPDGLEAADVIRAQAARIAELEGEVRDEKLNYSGLSSDLDSALQVLARRINGEKDLASAAEWFRLNYPRQARSLLSEATK